MSTINYWFGLAAPAGAKAAYGCRAILQHYRGEQSVDIVWDRQQATENVPPEFEKWVKENLTAWLNPKPRQRKIPKIGYVDRTGDEVHRYDDGKFHATACANRSYGYLYVGAWMDGDAEST